MSQIYTASSVSIPLSPLQEIVNTRDELESLVHKLDQQLHENLAIPTGRSLAEWLDNFLHEVMIENAKHRRTTLDALRREASWARLTDLSIMSDDLDQIGARATRNLQQIDEVKRLRRRMDPYTNPDNAASFAGYLNILEEILDEHAAREDVLRTVFINLKGYMDYLTQPRDHFEASLDILRTEMLFIRRELMTPIHDQLVALCERRARAIEIVSSTVAKVSQPRGLGIIPEEEQCRFVLPMRALYDQIVGQESVQSALLEEVKDLEKRMKVAPLALPDGHDTSISIESLLQAKDMHTRLQCRIIDLRQASRLLSLLQGMKNADVGDQCQVDFENEIEQALQSVRPLFSLLDEVAPLLRGAHRQ